MVEVNVDDAQVGDYEANGYTECTDCVCHDHSDKPKATPKKATKPAPKKRAAKKAAKPEVEDPDKSRNVEAEVEAAVEQGKSAPPADPTTPGAATTRTTTQE